MSLILKDIRLDLPEFTLSVDAELTAPITGLFGPSGAGKTTLLEIIAGLRRPRQGQVILHGRPLTDIQGRLHVPPAQRQVGYVPQDLALFPHLNAAANLLYGYRANGAVIPERVIEVLELPPLLHSPVQHLSGGEQQRVALGRALLANPRLLLLDEPLSSLDDRLKERILPYFRAVQAEFGVPILYVTHSQAELAALCDEVLDMERGRPRPRARGDEAFPGV
jgi:molybdate transport system ATP-binding protein